MAGIGSGLDVKGIVDNLMVSESLTLKKMQQKVSDQKIIVSGYGQLSGYIGTLKTNIDNLTTAINSGMTITTSDDTKLTASITNSAQVYTSTHSLNVSKLAVAESWGSSTPVTSRNTALGYSGDFTMTIGSNAFTISVLATDTLDNIRDKINNASANVGVTASVLTSSDLSGNDQFSLVVSSNKTGVANKVTLSGTAAASLNLGTELNAAQNAEFTFDGNSVIRSSNTVTDVMDGVSFNLLNTGTSTFSIALDQTVQKKAVSDGLHTMIDSYNQVLAFIDQVTAERTMTDSTVSNVKAMLKNMFRDSLPGSTGITSLFDMGIKYGPSVTYQTNKGKDYKSTGRLMVDDTALTTALNNSRDDIKKFITDKSTGFVTNVDNVIKLITGFQGSIPLRTDTLNNNQLSLNNKIALEQERLDKVRLDLMMKYSNLNSMMDKFDRIGSFLDATFQGMSTKSK